MPVGCCAGGLGRDSTSGSQTSWYWNGRMWQNANVVRWPWSGCFSFSGEGSVILDDENVPCLEPSSEIESVDSLQNESRQGSKGVASTSPVMSEVGLGHNEKKEIDVDRKECDEPGKKHSSKSYSSFDPSPPLEEGVNSDITGEVLENLAEVCDDQKPLLIGANSCSKYKEINGKSNELNCSVKKAICYEKIIPFPIATKDLNSEKCGAANLGYDDDDDTNDCVPVGCAEKSKDRLEECHSSLTPLKSKETLVLCNDLDNVCQVIPLSFSPNLYPDVGSVPLINCHASRKSALPSQIFTSVVSTKNENSDSFVTVLSNTKSPITSAASWPRRRPQSLRVAICYSSPECRQEGLDHVTATSMASQEIGMSDMSRGIQDVGPSASTTSFLKTWGSLENLEADKSIDDGFMGIESSFSHSQPNCSKMEDSLDAEFTHEQDVLKSLPTKDVILGNVFSEEGANTLEEAVKQEEEATVISQPLTQIAQINVKPTLSPQGDMIFNHSSYSSYLTSPSSDKENDPALLSVRPKVRQSPRKKKNSPKKKSKSPKKAKLGNPKEDSCKSQKCCMSVDYDDNLSLHKPIYGSFDDDVWAVDDFLPLPKRNFSHSLPREMQDFEVCYTGNFKAHNTTSSAVEGILSESSNSQTDVQNSSPTSSSCKDVDSSMIVSTFSTDTGYETETNKNENDYNLADKGEVLQKEQLEINHTNVRLRENDLCSGNASYSLTTPSEYASGATTPLTVADDLTEYFSITSELTNVPYSTLQNTGEDTPDYLSICSEMPGIPRLPEDSPQADLEVNQLYPEDVLISKSLSSPVDSPESGDLSTLTESPTTLTKSVMEEEDINETENLPQICPSEPSHSITPSPVNSHSGTPEATPSYELVEVKYVQLSLSIVLAIVLHAMQSISQFMLEIFLATEQEGHWD